jgi:four helix bundle protein
MIKTHKDLDVWKEAMKLAKEVYSLTASFPKEEMYGLSSQIRRASVSIPSNIAEGDNIVGAKHLHHKR